MVDTVEVTGKVNETLHDGANMIVLRMGKNTTVAASSVPFLLARDAIEDPELEADAPVFEQGVGNGGAGVDASSVQLKADGFAAPVSGGPYSGQPLDDRPDGELEDLRKRVTELDEECDTLVAERDAALKERDELQRQLDEARQSATIQGTVEEGGAPLSMGTQIGGFDHDGDGTAGGSKPYDPPALTGKNKTELLAIAAAEGVVIEDGATNAAIIEAIEAARASEDDAPAA